MSIQNRLKRAKARAELKNFRRTKGFMTPQRRAKRAQRRKTIMKGIGTLAGSALGQGALGIGKSLIGGAIKAGMKGGMGAAKGALTSGAKSAGTQLAHHAAGQALGYL